MPCGISCLGERKKHTINKQKSPRNGRVEAVPDPARKDHLNMRQNGELLRAVVPDSGGRRSRNRRVVMHGGRPKVKAETRKGYAYLVGRGERKSPLYIGRGREVVTEASSLRWLKTAREVDYNNP